MGEEAIVPRAERARNSVPAVVLLSTLVEFGGAMFRFVILLLVLERINDLQALGLVRATILLPSALFGFFIGAAFDVFTPRYLLKGVLLAGAVTVPLLPVALSTSNPVRSWALCCLSFIVAFCCYAGSVGVNVVIRHNTPVERLPTVVGYVTTAARGVALVAPLLGGLLVAARQDGAAMATIAASLVVAALLQHFRGPAAAATPPPSPRLWSTLTATWRYMAHSPGLLSLCAAVALANVAVAMYEVGYLVLLQQDYHLSAAGIGTVSAMLAVVALGAGLAASRAIDRFGSTWTLFTTAAILCAGFVALGVVRGLAVSVAMCAVLSCAATAFAVAAYSLRQATTPKSMIGGVIGLTGSLFKLPMPAGAVLAGWLASTYGTFRTFLAGGVFLALCIGVLLLSARQMNSMLEEPAS